jgi:KDO2-lipid IV(A) lauroyltransferase
MRGLLVKALLRLMAWLPLDAQHAIGTLLGMLLAWFPNTLHRVSAVNLQLCYPELDTRTRLLRASLIELGKSAAELGALWGWRPERLFVRVARTEGEDAMRAALAGGRGVIVLAPHLGAWELAGLYCARLGPMTSLYRPLRLAALDEFVKRARERSGARLVPATAAGIRALHQALARGEMIGILPDQEPGFGSGTFAPFFAQAALTMTLASRLAEKHHPAVFCVYAERLPRTRGYALHFVPVVNDITQPGAAGAAALNAEVECAVRRLPAQYQWSYKRFRSQPEGGVNPYRRG